VLTPAAETARCSTLADVIAVYGTENAKTIVFTSTKREVDELCASSALSALSPQALHGDFSQAQRDLTLRRFREGHFNVLVATDVAARGIDIQGIDLVVQYRLPQDPDSYVHRSGRTGRAGRTGTSLLLYSEREEREVTNLERRANVRFVKSGPPSTSTVMAAAAQLVPRRLKAVEPKVQKYFTAAAAELLAGDDVVAHVAQALALVAGKVTLTQRSLLTGEEGQTTLLLEASDGSMLTAGDAMAAINRLGKTSSGERAADHVGKIRACEDASQVRASRTHCPPLRMHCALGYPSLRRIKSTAVVPFTAVAPADVDAAHNTCVLRQWLRLPCCGLGGPGPLRVPSRQACCDVARAACC
jgi:ATP-dependent RNA helicase DDX21